LTQRPPNHFQQGAARHKQRGKGETKVINAEIPDFGLHAHPSPKPLEVNHRLAPQIADMEEASTLRH
jgi:hypothetical protein